VFNHSIELAGKPLPSPFSQLPSQKLSRLIAGNTVMGPLFGQTYHKAKYANTTEEFLRSREATSAAVAWSTALVGSALQSYGVGALLNATATLSYKGAAYLGALLFAANSAPAVSPPSTPAKAILLGLCP
jgi:hypothetical protein